MTCGFSEVQRPGSIASPMSSRRNDKAREAYSVFLGTAATLASFGLWPAVHFFAGNRRRRAISVCVSGGVGQLPQRFPNFGPWARSRPKLVRGIP